MCIRKMALSIFTKTQLIGRRPETGKLAASSLVTILSCVLLYTVIEDLSVFVILSRQ